MNRHEVVLRNVRKIEIRTKKLVEGLMSGAYHSVFKGRGIEFSEVREYVFGDDVRSIDWNVTARMNHPYVKEFIEERDLTVYIVFDISASSTFGMVKSKKDVAVELAASIMFSAMRNNDNVGIALFTDTIEKLIKPGKGRRHVLRLIRELIYYEPQAVSTDIEASLSYLAKVVKRRAIIFIISDFYAKGFDKPLKILREKHDIIAINTRDIREEQIPEVGLIELEDSETGEQLLVDTSDSAFQERYGQIVRKEHQELKSRMRKLKIDLIQLNTDIPFEIPLRKFFRKRSR